MKISGFVSYVNYNRGTDTTTIRLTDDTVVTCPHYVDVKINDKFYALVPSGPVGVKSPGRSPVGVKSPGRSPGLSLFADTSVVTDIKVNVVENNSYVRYFLEVYYKQELGNKIYSHFEKAYGNDIFCSVQRQAVTLIDNPTHYNPISVPVQAASWKKFLAAWYRNCYSRPIRILGITADMVDNMLTTDYTLYSHMKATWNPYLNPWIPPYVCDKLVALNESITDPLDQLKHGFSHEVSKFTSIHKWNYCPKKFLIIPEEYKYDICDRFGILDAGDKWYVKNIQRAQELVINYIIDLKGAVYNDTPVTPVHVPTKISPEQHTIVKNILSCKDNIVLVSGRAGTGKTRLIAELAKCLCDNGRNFKIASFTGKAVARVKESIQSYYPEIEADVTTIHRMLTINPEEPIEFLIFDEFSMISTKLVYKLLSNLYGKIKRIIGIGDNNQLSPIEWGSLYSQMYQSQVFVTYELKTCFRVTPESGAGILTISNGILDDPNFRFTSNDNFKRKRYPSECYQQLLDDAVSFTSTFDKEGIIITAYNRDREYFNEYIQKCLRKGIPKIATEQYTNRTFYVGDRVIQNENVNEVGIYNGDIGEVVEVHQDRIIINFSTKGYPIEYFLSEFKESFKTIKNKNTGVSKKIVITERNQLVTKHLDLAFAITVNKSQGSEFQYVMGNLTDIGQGKFVNKELIYTMVTRAQKMFFLSYNDEEKVNIHAKLKQSYKFDETAVILRDYLPQETDVSDFGYIGDDIDIADLIG